MGKTLLYVTRQLVMILLLSTSVLASEIIKVAVIDSGLDLMDPRFSKVLCLTGHRDFTGTGMEDHTGHGTHIAGLVKQYAGRANYCMIIYKVFEDHHGSTTSTASAFAQAIKEEVDFINYSAGGSTDINGEKEFIASHHRTTFVVAAGNDGLSLDTTAYSYYPASYKLPNVIAVGNLNKDGSQFDGSNFGRFVVWEVGTNVLSTFPNGKYQFMTGTSMAAAVHTGKLIRRMKK